MSKGLKEPVTCQRVHTFPWRCRRSPSLMLGTLGRKGQRQLAAGIVTLILHLGVSRRLFVFD